MQPTTPLPHTVLVANRGEIACRIITTLRRLGMRSVAVYSDVDAGARHVRLADEAVRLGPAPAVDSYLDIARVIDAARRTGARAIHPGYGFLAENAAFARACAAAGIVFVGPTPEAIETMGDKISARGAVEARGVPTVPGIARPGLTDEELAAGAETIGFPVLIKPSAGGGGKGMHVVTAPDELRAALATARREAAASFGDDALFLERFVATPRHIEVQVLADAHGGVVHLGERECSLQRRHQKVVEEAPSPLLDAATRARIGAAACETARSVGYRGAGTVEFIVSADRPDEFFFMEMNTRLQVEHPVTEMVTGLDLVELQLRIAAGEPLPFGQDEVALDGHSIEVRVYAEDPRAGFLPTGGRVLRVVHPGGDGIRVDSALDGGLGGGRGGRPGGGPSSGLGGGPSGGLGGGAGGGLGEGLDVPIDYDPMLAKLIAWGPDRETARRRLVRAIADTAVFGFETNLAFLGLLLEHPAVVAGEMDTGLIARVFDELAFPAVSDRTLAEAALVRHATERGASEATGAEPPGTATASGIAALATESSVTGPSVTGPSVTGPSVTGPSATGPWVRRDGWRLGLSAPSVYELDAGGRRARVRVWSDPLRVAVDDGAAAPASLALQDGTAFAAVDGRMRRFPYAVSGDELWLAADGDAVRVRDHVEQREREGDAIASPQLVSPLPGTVVLVPAADGAEVAPGDPVVVVEAMKMEHVLRSAVAGTVRLAVAVGDQVTRGGVVAMIETGEDA